MISQFCNLHAYSILLAYAGLMLHAIPSLHNIYILSMLIRLVSNSAASQPF